MMDISTKLKDEGGGSGPAVGIDIREEKAASFDSRDGFAEGPFLNTFRIWMQSGT